MQSEANIEQPPQSAYVQNIPEIESNPEPSNTAQTMARPDYFPKDLWDDQKGQPKVEDVYKKLSEADKRIEGFRKVLSDKKSFEDYKAKEGQPVEQQSQEEYKFDDDFPKDILKEEDFTELIEAAKLSGMNNKQLNDFTKTLTNNQIRENEEYKKAELEKLGPDAEKLIQNIDQFINARLSAKTFSEEEYQSLCNIVNKGGAAGVRAFAKVIEMTGERPIPVSVRASSEHSTLEDTRYAMVDALKRSGGKETPEIRQLRQKLERFN